MHPLSGPASILRNLGYQTIFACPHDIQFDNMEGFLRVNGFQHIISSEDFPGLHLKKPWNIADHVNFDLTFPSIQSASRNTENKPFFFVILTVSNHPPYTFPDPRPSGFYPQSSEMWQQSLEYADWSLRHFFSKAEKEPWFKETLFVLVADHGLNIHPQLDINPAFHHIPLIIYSPYLIPDPLKYDHPGMQFDLFPTLMHLISNLPSENSISPGINIFTHKRPFVFFVEDRNMGVMDQQFLLILERTTPKYLVKIEELRSRNPVNRLAEHPMQAKRMREYALVHLQVSESRIQTVPYLSIEK